MITEPKARRFRIRAAPGSDHAGPGDAPGAAPAPLVAALPLPASPPARRAGAARPLAPAPAVQPQAAANDPAPPAPGAAAPDSLDAIRAEGLTARQLRMARRVAQKQGLAAGSDYEAVRDLRARGIDPFKPARFLDLVQAAGGPGAEPGEAGARRVARTAAASPARAQAAPGASPPAARALPPTERADPATSRAAEIGRIQAAIARRRRRRLALLLVRLSVFVILPTLLAGWYFARVATPMYATRSEFVIQQAEAAGAAGLGGLFQGTSMATQQDSMTVQAYLASRAALARLDAEHGFRAHWSQARIDRLQRLPPDATAEDAYALYQDHVKIAYDPTEGIIKLEVVAADPQASQAFAEALIGYAEAQVDDLTRRLREDQMAGARASYEAAEARRGAALAELLRIQAAAQQIDPIGETAARTSQISALETERQRLALELGQWLAVPSPPPARVEALEGRIADIEALVAQMRSAMTQGDAAGGSLAAKNTELRLAEENYAFQTVLVQQALQQMEMARVEANRQVRYLSLGVEPLAPDEATYPRAFENTALAFLIFAGLYLMASLTASILREQVTT